MERKIPSALEDVKKKNALNIPCRHTSVYFKERTSSGVTTCDQCGVSYSRTLIQEVTEDNMFDAVHQIRSMMPVEQGAIHEFLHLAGLEMVREIYKMLVTTKKYM